MGLPARGRRYGANLAGCEFGAAEFVPSRAQIPIIVIMCVYLYIYIYEYMCVCMCVVYTYVHEYIQYLARWNVGVEKMHHLPVIGNRLEVFANSPALEEEHSSIHWRHCQHLV